MTVEISYMRFRSSIVVATTSGLLALCGCDGDQSATRLLDAATAGREAAVALDTPAQKLLEASNVAKEGIPSFLSGAKELRHAADATLRSVDNAREPVEDLNNAATSVKFAVNALLPAAKDLLASSETLSTSVHSVNALSHDLRSVGSAVDKLAGALPPAATKAESAARAVQESVEAISNTGTALKEAASDAKSAAETANQAVDNIVKVHASVLALLQATHNDNLSADETADATTAEGRVSPPETDRDSIIGKIHAFLDSNEAQSLAFAAALIAALFFLAQWSWHILASLEKRKGNGDAAFAIVLYLLASISICLIGASFFALRHAMILWKGEWQTCCKIVVIAWAGMSVLSLGLVWVLAFYDLHAVTSQVRPKYTIYRPRILVITIALLIGLGVVGLVHTGWGPTDQALRVLMVIVLVMFGIGTDAVVRRDDFALLKASSTGPDEQAHAVCECPLQKANI